MGPQSVAGQLSQDLCFTANTSALRESARTKVHELAVKSRNFEAVVRKHHDLQYSI